MNTEKKLREAVEYVLDKKMFKSVNQLANMSGIEQASLFRFRKGGMIKIDVASKLIDMMGGILIFPWEKNESNELPNEFKCLKDANREKS